MWEWLESQLSMVMTGGCFIILIPALAHMLKHTQVGNGMPPLTPQGTACIKGSRHNWHHRHHWHRDAPWMHFDPGRARKGASVSVIFPFKTSIYRGFSSKPCLITGG